MKAFHVGSPLYYPICHALITDSAPQISPFLPCRPSSALPFPSCSRDETSLRTKKWSLSNSHESRSYQGMTQNWR